MTDTKDFEKLEAGCYLTFSEASWGSLFEQWALKHGEFKEEVFAYFKPGSKVPGFKYKNKGGKSEIQREIQAGKGNKYYIGWTMYMKTAKAFAGTLTIFREKDVEVYYVDNSGNVNKFEPKVEYDLAKLQIHSVAAIPAKAGTYDGVKSIEPGTFRENARKVGASLTLV
eukprot:CAMPEP_0184484494 /NCGR_PEP_ID=MMETSP0113_2-20130426/6208_1 /TAXON_ID=91329 /ORGANISM="Norrisiella sphaerica, Strain BC52" /LENGTH=168 /DNA_ID=CAMNT_0026865507 /DNA_START=27 /DNA_END=533 /DNA_ORIENTATION=-